MKRTKTWLAILLCLCMTVLLMPTSALAADGPEEPSKNGDVWTVNPNNAQATLDGAFGSIDGKTIHFSEGTYSEVLVLARPTKYEGSNTKYYNMNWTQQTGWVKEDQPLPYDEFIQNPSNIVTYERKVSNVTFTGEEGLVLPGFTSSSGHVYGAAYDYVREVEIVNTTNSYYGACSLENIIFSGLTIKDSIAIANYGTATNTGIKIVNCTFQGDAAKMAANGYAAISLKADSRIFEDIEVSGCTITNYFQGIYSQGSDGIQVKNNVFDGTTHNAIAVQNGAANTVCGEVVIEENIIKNASDRAIRFGNAADAEKITIENNVIKDSGDSDGELIKGVFPADSSVVSLEHNYWDGKPVETAVANAEVRPETTGIVNGVCPENVDAYRAQGYVSKDNGDGTFTVAPATDTITLVSGAAEDQTLTVEAGKTETLPVPTWDGHDFQGWFDSDGHKVENYTATADGTGNVTFTAKWEHPYGKDWKTDENGHWHECACGDKANAAEHTFKWVTDKEATATEKGSKHEECETCGYKKAAVEIPATGDPDAPQTGVSSSVTLCMTLLVLACGGLTGTLLYSRKRRTHE